MYDRKTWIVLVICSALLVANFYFSAQNQKEQSRQNMRDAQTETQAEPVTAADETAPGTATAELSVQPIEPTVEESLVTLSNEKVVFTLTNIGGGIKFAEFVDEFEVGSKSARVRLNRFGSGPVGTISKANGELQNVAYSYKADESIDQKKAVYIAKLPSGLIVKKTYSLVSSDKPGSDYLLQLNLQVENTTDTSKDLSDWGLFMGEASPLYLKEWPQQTGFFYREGGAIQFTNGSTFKGGWFSSPKAIIRSSPDNAVEFAGVTNQFFATVIRPEKPQLASIWAKSEQVELPAEAAAVTSVRAGLHLPAKDLQPGEIQQLDYHVFIGPKHNIMLRKMENHWGEGWGDVMQYGWFWFVSRPLNWLLNTYHNLLDHIAKNWSWGLAIIFLTITVRFLIWPLHAKSTHTMKRMAKLKPEMDKLKERYPDDPNKLNTEMMGLYRKYGINPLGGCLPMLIQI
ncbi:MAG: membrane protein insertase YidC, partial [Luteolibacter sp.]